LGCPELGHPQITPELGHPHKFIQNLGFLIKLVYNLLIDKLIREKPMPQPRYRLVDPQATPYYHCVSRCVRRAFLCGYDQSSNKNFDHRKQWILDRIKMLSSVFSIDVCAYAIMSNHFHLVLHIDTDRSQNWSSDEIIDRWLTLFSGPALAQRYKAGRSLSQQEQNTLATWIEVWRSRLASISWFMRSLNEVIARMANQEDNCTGRFWEGRFRSQALLDEAALVSCMAYVDLNPVRAGMAETLEQSEFTSIEERLRLIAKNRGGNKQSWLAPLTAEKPNPSSTQAERFKLPIRATDYFALVDWTGRAVRSDKQGSIPARIKPILHKLNIIEDNWVDNTRNFGKRFGRALGRIEKLREFALQINQNWLHGHAQAMAFYR
jgi:REP element-mobilizing transposase RayT